MKPERLLLEQIDASLHRWARRLPAGEDIYPVLIDADTLHRAEYHRAFPHLLMSTTVTAAPGEEAVFAGYYLSPAVCYHTYASLEGRILPDGVAVTARSRCFRNEDAAQLEPGRRQIEFDMREVVFAGTRDWVEDRLAAMTSEVAALANTYGIEGTWEPASDPFFLPSSGGKAAMQRLFGTKMEYTLPSAADLAIASINRHGTFFGERFGITAAEDHPARTACVAFGLDRWASQARLPGARNPASSATQPSPVS